MNTQIEPDQASEFEFAALEQARNYRHAIVREFAPWLRGRLLEAGAGCGQMTELLLRQSAIDDLVCIEPDDRFCRKHREMHPGARLLQGTVDALPADDSYDAILSVNVLEHIADDDGELAKYAALLRNRRGALCLFVPARPEIYSAIDRAFGHHRRYTRKTLRAKLERAGFALARLDYFNLLGYFAWAANFRLLGRINFDPRAVRLFDERLFPIGAWFEQRILRPPIGQSLLAVAKPR